jgi:hypothetical protein
VSTTPHDGETARSAPKPIRALHHLPRGRNAWNPPFMKKWWFWPACIGALAALNGLASLMYGLLG